MAKIKFILDKQARKDGTNIVMLSFIHKGYRKQATLGIKVHPENWEAESVSVSTKEKNHRHINQRLQFFRSSAEGVLLRHYGLQSDGATIYADLEAALFPDKVEEKQEAKIQSAKEAEKKESLLSVAKRLAAMKKQSTRLTYERTIKHLGVFVDLGHSDKFDDINKGWLSEFEVYLTESNPSVNARALHMRNLRAIINYAIDEGITSNYAFRRHSIKTVKTAKRNLSVEELRQVFDYAVEDWQVVYRDMFKLSFMLMGVNFADLLNLEKSDMRSGRIEFNRHKTARLYSMKVEPEAAALIEQYGGAEHLLKIMDTRTDYVQFIRQTNHALKCIGTQSVKGRKPQGEPLVPGITTYWARHTWATIAASLDIPKETIAAALGHGGNTVTDIYIDFDRKKVDDANRKVLDWVLYGKKDGVVVDPAFKVAEAEAPAPKRRGRSRKIA